LEQAAKELQHLIIWDIKIPKLNGSKLLSELKKLLEKNRFLLFFSLEK
jgi:YesN/AraC family two-component response regulator